MIKVRPNAKKYQINTKNIYELNGGDAPSPVVVKEKEKKPEPAYRNFSTGTGGYGAHYSTMHGYGTGGTTYAMDANQPKL